MDIDKAIIGISAKKGSDPFFSIMMSGFRGASRENTGKIGD
jgi:hypothetical protein